MRGNYEEIINKTLEIQTKRMILRPFTMEDSEAVLSYGSDEQTLKYLIWNGITDLVGAEKVITEYYSRPGIYALESKESNQCIGCIDLRVEPDHEKASFGYVLKREFFNQGYMTEALMSIIKFCFEELELNRVEATHYVGNEGSGRVMEKSGMMREGLSIHEVKIKGVFHDVVHYGITKLQWEEKNKK